MVSPTVVAGSMTSPCMVSHILIREFFAIPKVGVLRIVNLMNRNVTCHLNTGQNEKRACVPQSTVHFRVHACVGAERLTSFCLGLAVSTTEVQKQVRVCILVEVLRRAQAQMCDAA